MSACSCATVASLNWFGAAFWFCAAANVHVSRIEIKRVRIGWGIIRFLLRDWTRNTDESGVASGARPVHFRAEQLSLPTPESQYGDSRTLLLRLCKSTDCG